MFLRSTVCYLFLSVCVCVCVFYLVCLMKLIWVVTNTFVCAWFGLLVYVIEMLHLFHQVDLSYCFSFLRNSDSPFVCVCVCVFLKLSLFDEVDSPCVCVCVFLMLSLFCQVDFSYCFSFVQNSNYPCVCVCVCFPEA